MCCIIHSPDSKHRPSLRTLRAVEARNRDGIGIAWMQNGQVSYLKGLSVEGVADCLRILEGDVVIHFRLASAGGKDSRLCHPFPVTDDATPKMYGHSQCVMFHNGHWSGYKDFLRENRITLKGPVSDTRAIAIGVWLDGADFLKDKPGRFLRMSAQRGIQRFGDWFEKGGMHFSNLMWDLDPQLALPIKDKAKEPEKLNVKPAATYQFNPHLPEKQPKVRYTGHSLVEEALACFGD